MSTAEQQHEEEQGVEDIVTNYVPPPQKTIGELVAADQEDESLRKYKETLLGNAITESIIIEPNNPKKVLVKKLVLVSEGQTEKTLDLSGDLSKLKDTVFIIKEGVQYRIRIEFFVQQEIVTGLKYVQKTYRKGLQVDKMTHMVGSYAPKRELQSYTTPLEDAPSGLLYRGHYNVTSLFTDDDGHEHLKWEWSFEIKKDWN
uniref:Rho GDP-dissociation inhibitor 3 n=1 Tax=Alona affinis TaxID=381656 RepID=A0A9N6ZF06_9CRUS|nr:EOG090X0EJY [Alona affinis]